MPQAMVNVDFSPALVLGLGMVAGGVLLYNVRVNRPWISRDYDVVISSVSVLVGGILIFQVAVVMMLKSRSLSGCLRSSSSPEASYKCLAPSKVLCANRAGGSTRCCCLASC